MFPVALLSGILFPSIATGSKPRVGDRMNSTGITTLVNTTGRGVRSARCKFRLAAGFWLPIESHCCAPPAMRLLSILVTRTFALRRHVASLKDAVRVRALQNLRAGSMVLHWSLDCAEFSFSQFFRTDAPKRISNTRAVHTKRTIRVMCSRAW